MGKQTRIVVLTAAESASARSELLGIHYFVKRMAADGSWVEAYGNGIEKPTRFKAADYAWRLVSAEEAARRLAGDVEDAEKSRRREELRRRVSETQTTDDNRTRWIAYKATVSDSLAVEACEAFCDTAAEEKPSHLIKTSRRMRALVKGKLGLPVVAAARKELAAFTERFKEATEAQRWMLWNCCNQAAKNASEPYVGTRTAAGVAYFWCAYSQYQWDLFDKAVGEGWKMRDERIAEMAGLAGSVVDYHDIDVTVYRDVFDNLMAETADSLFIGGE